MGSVKNLYITSLQQNIGELKKKKKIIIKKLTINFSSKCGSMKDELTSYKLQLASLRKCELNKFG